MAKFFMVVGVLVMLGTGGCSVWGVAMFHALRNNRASIGESAQILGLVFVIGIVPFLIGLFTFKAANKSNKMQTYLVEQEMRAKDPNYAVKIDNSDTRKAIRLRDAKILQVIGVIIMMVAGGWILYLLGKSLGATDPILLKIGVIALLGGVPFAIGLKIFFYARRLIAQNS